MRTLPFVLRVLSVRSTNSLSTWPTNSDMNDDSEHSALAKAMRDAGAACCETTASVNDVLRKAGFDNSKRPNEEEIARALGLMVSRYTRSNGQYAQDFTALATVLSQKDVDWVKVIRALDYPDLKITAKSGFEYIVKAFRSADKVQCFE
jgi:CCR4-NOT transcription complex subunit 1